MTVSVAGRDPAVKLGVGAGCSRLVLVLVIDPITPLLFIAAAWIARSRLRCLSAGAFARTLAPLAVVAPASSGPNAVFAVPATPGDTFGILLDRGERVGLRFGVGIGLAVSRSGDLPRGGPHELTRPASSSA